MALVTAMAKPPLMASLKNWDKASTL